MDNHTDNVEGNKIKSIVSFGDEAVCRNGGILTVREQAALRSATVLVAGCGSVGGSVVEPLARLGMLRFRLADPDSYDITNLNRQACVTADLGQAKPEVLARRVRDISPSAEVRTFSAGLTLENLPEALEGAHVVFDGVDPSMSSWVKYQLHAMAAELGIPVVAGADFGGKPVVYVFDYRRNPIPFYGKASADAHRENRLWESVRWFGYTHFPSDYLPVMTERMQNGGPWPQISYCVMGMGALGSRVIIDLLMNRRVRHVITVDLHAAAMPWKRVALHRARVPVETIRLFRSATQSTRKSRPHPRPEKPLHPLPEALATVLDAARHAPSPYNSQPWSFTITGQNSVRIAPEFGRWPAFSAEAAGWVESLGCAREAMFYLARGYWEPGAPGDSMHGDWFAGEFMVERLREGAVLARRGILRLRSTQRENMLRIPLDNTTLRGLENLCADLGVVVETIIDRRLLDQLAMAATDRQAGALDYLALGKVSRWLRHRDQNSRRPHTDTYVSGLPRSTVALMRLLETGGPPHFVSKRLLTASFNRAVARWLHNCGALVVLRAHTDTISGRLEVGAALMRVWLTLVDAGYAAQPLHGELASAGIGNLMTELSTDRSAQDLPIAGVLRTGRALSSPPAQPVRLPLTALVSAAVTM